MICIPKKKQFKKLYHNQNHAVWTRNYFKTSFTSIFATQVHISITGFLINTLYVTYRLMRSGKYRASLASLGSSDWRSFSNVCKRCRATAQINQCILTLIFTCSLIQSLIH